MLSLRLCHVLFLVFLHCINGQRRITNGESVKGTKRYMVYLIQAQASTRNYDAWICGGCILNSWFILTSGACIEDVKKMYAIAGTNDYIPRSQIHKNKCSIHMKKKIVASCVPAAYNFTFSKITNWSYNDIALLKVDTPYDYFNENYTTYCKYRPNAINVNFDLKYEKEGTDVIVLGFGHRSIWRNPNTKSDWNAKRMEFTSTQIFNIDKCKKFYESPDITEIIDKFMICTQEKGQITENFETMKNARRIQNRSKFNSTYNLKTRRQGICQNDHGGPLVSWINNSETVIGVASVFQVNSEQKCTGPYLFTSTARNKNFIECIISMTYNRRNDICDQPEKRGFSILRRYFSWNENEDQVADNEDIKIRPQLNMNFIGMG